MDVISGWDLDVWSRESNLALGVNDIRVNQTHLDLLAQLRVNYEFMFEDLAAAIAEEKLALDNRNNAPLADWFDAYHPYAEQVAFLQSLASQYSHLLRYNPSIGQTILGNNIPAVIITGPNNNPNKKKVFFSAQQHAREWIASHTILYILRQFVSLYETDASVKLILDNAIIHIVPLVNPDGYIYTHATGGNRLWRKNRRANTGGSFGVDLNRNWNDHWGGEGSSRTPTSDTYCGIAPFSEPESTAVATYVNQNGPFDAGIDWHSYSQLILRPYGWTTALPPNDALAKRVGDTMRDRIRAVNNIAYTSQPSWALYYTTGSAQDWYYSEGKMPLSYTIELRDTGAYGFILPAVQIIPTGNENWAAAKYFLQHVTGQATEN